MMFFVMSYVSGTERFSNTKIMIRTANKVSSLANFECLLFISSRYLSTQICERVNLELHCKHVQKLLNMKQHLVDHPR